MKKKQSGISTRDIAKAAGVSKSTVSYALHNHPGVNAMTRQRVLEVATRLGYAPDPRIASWLTTVRSAGAKELLPIAWLNTAKHESTWRKFKYLSPYLEGAQARAQELGYRLDEIWAGQSGMSMRRINQVLGARGIEGMIITYPARHLRLDWSGIASVSLEASLLAPHLHHIVTDHIYNLLLALKALKRAGYKRIGVCLDEEIDRGTTGTLRAAAHFFYSTTLKAHRVKPLFYAGEGEAAWQRANIKQVQNWLRSDRPEVVIGHSMRLLECVQDAGYRVPQDIGVVHLATDDDAADWAGVNSNKRDIGAVAAETVISLVQRRQFGLPNTTMNTSVRGSWHPGRTVLLPKPI